MDDCCVRSFVDKGFREGFKLAVFGARHTCPTCGQVFELRRRPEADTPEAEAYTWQPVTH